MKKTFLRLAASALVLTLVSGFAFAAAPKPGAVVVSPQGLIVNGEAKNAQKYNIDGSNYFKLRDIAYLLNGTQAQFSVGWDAASATVSITTGQAYTPDGSELKTQTSDSPTAVPTAQTILIGGVRRDDLFVYNVGGSNYFKLRDLGQALGFQVDYDAARNAAVVTSPVKENAAMQLTVGGKIYFIGMTEKELRARAGIPATKLASTYDCTWNVYGTGDYTDFLLAGVKDDKVVALVSGGKAFTYLGRSAGAKAPDEAAYVDLYTDKNDGGILHAVRLRSDTLRLAQTVTDEMLFGEATMNYHMVNAFRVYHGMPILGRSMQAEAAALAHSKDMADKNYFDHTGADGRDAGQRMSDAGVQWRSCGENISAGRKTGVDAYDGWVNSEGHRRNMLGDYRMIGVGAAYNAGSEYGFYFTQDFYTES